MDLNDLEINLLHNNPNKLIVSYQSMIKIIVLKFVNSGHISISEKEDFIQIVNEKLLKKIPKIIELYDGSTLLKTYISVIIRNICLEEVRKKKHTTIQDIENKDYQLLSEDRSDKNIIIEQEFTRLNSVFRLQFEKRCKLEFCLKVIYRIFLVIEDFTKYCVKFSIENIKILLERINPPKKLAERDLYVEIMPFINKCDNKNNSSDAIRKWIKKEIDDIIELMNGNPKRANYDKETIQILVEKYYEKENENFFQKNK